jgi:hypothetical protein
MLSLIVNPSSGGGRTTWSLGAVRPVLPVTLSALPAAVRVLAPVWEPARNPASR